MNVQRIRWVFWGVLAFLLIVLWGQWQQRYHPRPQTLTSAAHNQSQSSQASTAANNTDSSLIQQRATSTTAAGQSIHVKTDLLNVTINTQGGEITQSALQQYDQTLKSHDKIKLFDTSNGQFYVGQSGVLPGGQNQIPLVSPIAYQTPHLNYQLQPKQDQLQVVLSAKLKNGLTVEKIYHFSRGRYVIGVETKLINQGSHAWHGQLYAQLVKQNKAHSKNLLDTYTTYTGAAISTHDKNYEKVSFEKISQENLNQPTQGGWVSMLQHYFLTAWVPQANQQNTLYSAFLPGGRYAIGFKGPFLSLQPGQSAVQKTQLYAGPIVAKRLSVIAPNLQRTLDYGWFWFISEALFWVMEHFSMLLGNWGLAIILTTVVVKLIFLPLTAKSYRSMARMRTLQPEIKAIQERYKDDRQKAGQAVMTLYREKKVNPLGGCLPMVIQIPVFIALYWMIMESVQLRHAPFFFWIHDLSVKDPYYVLPVLMGISMFVQQRLTPAPPDPTQAKIMMFLPVVFTFLFAHFPAGLVLYWIVNNLLTILQQWWMMRAVTPTAKGVKKKG